MRVRHLRPEDLAGKRWRGLVRESTAAQADRWSPERQRDDLRRAADDLGLIPVEPLFYERVGSGEAVGAEELEQAVEDATQYDVLLVLTTSRFARNRAEAVRMKAEFQRAGIVIYFVADRIISGSRVGSLTEGIKEVIDQEENEQRRFWVAGGMRQRQVSGRWVGVVPIGYRKELVDFADGTRGWDGGLVVDNDFAPLIRRIYEKGADGVSVRGIAAWLEVNGHLTNRGRRWTSDMVYDVLTNDVYTGRLVRYRRAVRTAYYDLTSPDGQADMGEHFPAIIEPQLAGRVRASLASRRPRRAA